MELKAAQLFIVCVGVKLNSFQLHLPVVRLKLHPKKRLSDCPGANSWSQGGIPGFGCGNNTLIISHFTTLSPAVIFALL